MVRTRFAPSPTGFLHIGGVRTALFNWLFAKKHGGQFILRIDDTDAERNVAETLQPILDGFRWLGIDWDEGADDGGREFGDHGPYYQSKKLARYQEAVRQLVETGHAYWDYATPEEVKAEREAAEKEKRSFVYSRRWMAETPAQRTKFEGEGRQGVVRLKMKRDGFCEFDDHVRGKMQVAWSSEQDHVVQRADGTVLYNLASVVDDFDMKITHVIRAEEHLSNTPRQIFILDTLGYPRPEYAHIPFVAEPGSKNKLSKRKIVAYLKNPDFKKVYEHGKAIADRLGVTGTAETFNPVLVEFYEKVGYLPDAILNYLILLGWSHEDGKSEFFTRQQMMDLFTLERVNKASASFDPKKLTAFQDHYMRQVPIGEKVEHVSPFLVRAGLVSEPVTDAVRSLVTAVITEAAHRLVVFGDILEYAYFFQADDQFVYDDKALEKHLRKPPAPSWLPKLRDLVASAEPFDTATLKARVEDFAKGESAKPGDLSQSLRVATTGKATGFDAYATLAILGRERCLARIDRVVGQV